MAAIATRLLREPSVSHLIVFGKATFLIDTGLPGEIFPSLPAKIDAILLSHSALSHCGGLPAISKQYPSTPIYATFATAQMAKQTLLEHESVPSYPDREIRNFDELFRSINTFRYLQPTIVQSGQSSFTIAAHNAGHSLGGTIWKITSNSLRSSIVVAIDWNHSKEHHLNAGISVKNLTKPDCLITDAKNLSPPMRKLREQALTETILQCISTGKDILIPCDAASRVLEMVVLLEGIWDTEVVSEKPSWPVFLSKESHRTVTLAASMLEWMNEEIQKEFSDRDNPFELKHVKCLNSVAKLNQLSGSRIILCPAEDLSTSFSLDLIISHLKNPMVLLTSTLVPSGSLAGQMLSEYKSAFPENWVQSPLLDEFKLVREIELEVRDALSKEELQEYQSKQRHDSQRRRREELIMQHNKSILDASDSEDSDEEAPVLNKSGEVMRGSDVLLEETFDFFVEGAPAELRQTSKMFPYQESRRKVDDYGEILVEGEFESRAIQEMEAPIAVTGAKRKFDSDKTEDMNKKRKVAAAESFLDEDQLPTKARMAIKSVELQCSLKFIEFSGLHDGRSLGPILDQLAPSTLVFTAASMGELEKAMLLAEEVPNLTKDIHFLDVGQPLTLSIGRGSWDIIISDALLKSLKWQDVNGLQLAQVSGLIQQEDDDADSSVLAIENEQEKTVRLTTPLQVGNLRLLEVRDALQKHGFKAEFRGEGVLVANGRVKITKSSEGRLAIESNVDENSIEQMCRIRDSLYERLAFV